MPGSGARDRLATATHEPESSSNVHRTDRQEEPNTANDEAQSARQTIDDGSASTSIERFTDNGLIDRLKAGLPKGMPDPDKDDDGWSDPEILRWTLSGLLSHYHEADRLAESIYLNTKGPEYQRLFLRCAFGNQSECEAKCDHATSTIGSIVEGNHFKQSELERCIKSRAHAQLTTTWMLIGNPLCEKHAPSIDDMLADVDTNGPAWPSDKATRREKFAQCGMSIDKQSSLYTFPSLSSYSYTRRASKSNSTICALLMPINRSNCAEWPVLRVSDEGLSDCHCSFVHILTASRKAKRTARRNEPKKSTAQSRSNLTGASHRSDALDAQRGAISDALVVGINPSSAPGVFPSQTSLDIYERFLGNLDQHLSRPCLDLIESPVGVVNRLPNNWFPGTELDEIVYTERDLRDAKKAWLRSERARNLVTHTHTLGAYVPQGEDEEYFKQKYDEAPRTEETCSSPNCGGRISRTEALTEEWPWRDTDGQGTETAVYCHWGCQYQTMIEEATREAEESLSSKLQTKGRPHSTPLSSRADSHSSYMSTAPGVYTFSGGESSDKRRKTGGSSSRGGASPSTDRSTMFS